MDDLVKKFADAIKNKAFANIIENEFATATIVFSCTGFLTIHTISNAVKMIMLNGSFAQRIRTSLGYFQMEFWQVRYSKNSKTSARRQSSSFRNVIKPINLKH